MADAEAHQSRAPRTSSARWLPLTFSIIAAALVIGISYSAVRYLRNTTFSDERAFRVLGEMIGQYHNFETALVGLLSLAPAEMGNGDQTAEERSADFSRTLALRSASRLDVSMCEPQAAQQAPRLELDASSAHRVFRVISACTQQRTSGNQAKQANAASGRSIVLSGSFTDEAPRFLSQQFFDVAILATSDGAVLANVRGTPREFGVDLHRTRGEHLLLVDVRGLLRHAAIEEEREDRGDGAKTTTTTDAKTPSHPMVLTDRIAGETYRVFVHSFEPDHPLSLRVSGQARPEQRLFLVGLKRQEVLQPMLDTLGDGGVLAITLFVLLAIMGWPLLGLRFSAPQEALAPAQVFAVLVALLLIPSVIAVCGFSIWSRYRLTVWADEQAERYGRNVEAALLEELSEDVRILDHLGAQFIEVAQLSAPDDFLKGEQSQVCIKPATCTFALSPPTPMSRAAVANWSPLRSGAPLNLEGRSSGLRFNMFGAPSPGGELSLGDREYVQAISRGEEWRPGELWASWSELNLYRPAHGFVAQRLFNRSDAARALQVTTPLYASTQRIGMITADSRAYAFTAAIRPPLMRFAVIDDGGAVIFHSDDSRSLAENLLVETEQNKSLRMLLSKRTSQWNFDRVNVQDHFSGRYLGAPHRFYYRAVAGAPWGVVVFYSAESLSEIVLHTAVATLAAYFALATLAILVFGLLVVVVPGRLDRAALAALWPKWSARQRYGPLAWSLTLAALLLAALLFVRWRAPVWTLGLLIATVLALGAAIAWAVRSGVLTRPAARAIGVEQYQQSYVRCLVGAMVIVAALPTVWLAGDYYDTSVRAFIRTELQQAASDVQYRRWVIANDLQRFYGRALTAQDLEQARVLSEKLRAPGFRVAEEKPRGGGGERSRMARWEVADAPEGLWLARCGAPILGSVRRTIWMLSTSSHARRERISAAVSAGATQPNGSRGEQRALDARDPCKGARHRAGFWMRRDDAEWIAVTMPIASAAAPPLQRDPELEFRSGAGGALLLILLLLLGLLFFTLLAWYVARRLFGVRTPFAGRFGVNSQGQALEITPLLEAELELLALKKQHGAAFTSKDEADWRSARCRPLYEALWNTLDQREQLLVHQLAHGRFANPENRTVIEGLLSRGYLKLWPWPRIADAGFAEFLRASETEHNFAQMQRDAAKNWWQRIRTPLLVVVIVIAALLMWVAGSAMQILSATLAGVAALFSSLTQVTAFARSGGGSSSK